MLAASGSAFATLSTFENVLVDLPCRGSNYAAADEAFLDLLDDPKRSAIATTRAGLLARVATDTGTQQVDDFLVAVKKFNKVNSSDGVGPMDPLGVPEDVIHKMAKYRERVFPHRISVIASREFTAQPAFYKFVLDHCHMFQFILVARPGSGLGLPNWPSKVLKSIQVIDPGSHLNHTLLRVNPRTPARDVHFRAEQQHARSCTRAIRAAREGHPIPRKPHQDLHQHKVSGLKHHTEALDMPMAVAAMIASMIGAKKDPGMFAVLLAPFNHDLGNVSFAMSKKGCDVLAFQDPAEVHVFALLLRMWCKVASTGSKDDKVDAVEYN